MSPGHESRHAVNRPYFFLSYARTPKLDPSDSHDPDLWVHKLYRDLCLNILHLTNAQPGSVGYMDRNNRPGARWPRELAQALATCRVFVPLYSQRYFHSKNCGMEWFAFARREVNHRAKGLKPAHAIVPALWATVRPDGLPGVAKPIQYDHPELGARYRTEGFFGIIKLKRYRKDYEVAVYELARRIVGVAHETQIISEQPSNYASLQNAFALGSAGDPGRPRDQMRITVLALDTSTLPEGRTRDYYGSTPPTWSPYHPESAQPLADYAADLAACLGCQPAIGAFDERTPYWATNGRRVPPGLCLIDAWAAVSPPHQEPLRRLDELEEPWVSVLVPWNSQDTELAAAEQHLRQGLNLSLRRKITSVPYRCRMAATGIPTLQEFGELLPQMAMIMLKRFRKVAPAYPPKGPPIERPRLRMADPEDPGGSR